jgi:MEMO1 family protein
LEKIMGNVREPAVSGTFYPSNPDVLKQDLQAFLSKVRYDGALNDIVGLVSPHAGYMYSGQTAAYGYKAITGSSYDTVILLAPSHRSFFVGAAVQDEGAYKTPLGTVPIDENLAAKLVRMGGVVRSDANAHRGEHALEVQLPFLQFVLGDFSILPIIMGTQDSASCEELSASICQAIRDTAKKYLIVGSSDLSHYYPYESARDLDMKIVARLEAFDEQGLMADIAGEKAEACGAGPIATTMMICRRLGATSSRVLQYVNSGDVSGDRSSVVGYVSCAFFKGR